MVLYKRKDKIQEEVIDDYNDNSFNDFTDESYNDFDTGIKKEADVYKIWLDTEPYLNSLYLAFTNKERKLIKYTINGKEEYRHELRQIPNTSSLANEQGISQLMNELRVFINTHTAQANFITIEQYNKFMLSYYKFIMRIIWANRKAWGISKEDCPAIIHRIEGSVSLFLTRPIGNLERGRDRWKPEQNSDEGSFTQKVANIFRKRKGMGELNG